MEDPLVVISVFLAAFVGIYALILSEKVHKTLAALLGFVIVVALGRIFNVFSYDAIYDFLELDVISLLIGTFIISKVAEEIGIFEFVAIKFLKASEGEPFRLFLFFSILIVVVSTVLSNLVAMVLVSSLTIVACKDLDLDPKPYILGEAIFANLGGLVTLVSSVPNILVASAANIGYLEFLQTSLPLCLTISVITFYLLLYILDIKKVKSDKERQVLKHRVEAFEEWNVIKNRTAFYSAVALMIIVLFLFTITDVLEVGLEYIAITGGTFMLILSRVDIEKTLRGLDWSIIFFVGSLLVVVKGISAAGVLEAPARLLVATSGNFLFSMVSILWIVGILSSIIVDIPLTVVFIPIVQELAVVLGSDPRLYWWAVIFGLGLGANYTPVGSSSTIIGLSALRKKDVFVSFKEFTILGLKVCTIQLMIGMFYLSFLHLFLGY
jgi:Na+/H+ antiporter NhaD/arsenite permease-like protein